MKAGVEHVMEAWKYDAKVSSDKEQAAHEACDADRKAKQEVDRQR